MRLSLKNNGGRRVLTRRGFVKSAAVAASVLARPWIVPHTALASPGRPGANDRVDIALFGMGVRGSQLVDNMPELGRVVAVADPNRSRAAANTKRKNGAWAVFDDPRRLLDREKVDGVVCCNTDHNHIHTAILACQAGADLYVEKPFCHTIAEGRVLVELANRHGRILQAGTQSRSIPINQVLLTGIRDGRWGKLKAVVCRAHRIARPTPSLEPQPLPEGMNWDVWLGPAPQLPYNEEYVKNWLQFRHISQWTNGGWGAHAYDMIQNALGAEDTGPVAIWPTGPRSHYGEYEEALNTKLRMKYASGDVVRMEVVRGTGPDVGAIFVCEDAKIEVNRNTFKSNPPDLIKELPPDPDGAQEVTNSPSRRGWMGRYHVRNWLQCVVNRRQPAAHGELAQRAGTLCCLTTIARILNRPLKWDPTAEQFVGDDEANRLIAPPRRQGYELPAIDVRG